MSTDQLVRQNPFPGLRPFTTEEDYLFFGREEQTTELLGLLREHRFLAVVGTSGSGKSSLVRAGLLPALHGGTMAQAGSAWEVVLLRPGGAPIANLARALVDADLYDSDDEESLPRIVATLNRSRLGLVEAVRQSDLPEGTNLLVVVDQFEELFRFRQAGLTHQEAASAFVKLLLAAAREADRRIYVAITMRSDYLGECSHIAGLAEAVNDGEYLIPRLSRDQRRAAIEKPVSVGGGTISHRLVQKLLNDVGDDADHLPVLQHALMRIFDYWAEDHAEGEPLDLRHYERAGGLQEALARHADEVYDELPNDRLRTVAEKLFKALTERGSDNRGIRRPTRLDALCAIIDAQQEEVGAVIEAFRRSGRTFLMPMAEVELTAHTVIDISHESLMRVWTRLGRWVEEESQSARIYRRLADTAALHAEGKAGIYHDPDLQIALSWRETAQPTEAWAGRYHAGFEQALAFLEESRAVQHAEKERIEAARQRELEQAKKLAAAERSRAQVQKRAAHRLKWLSSGAAVVAGLALVAFGVAMSAWQESQQLAEQEARAAADERTARAEAEEAKNREAKEKDQAEQARKEADASRKSALVALQKAEENFAKARGAVNDYLTAVSEDERLKAPGLQGLRIQLLQSALQFYQQFLKERGNDPTLRRELAGVYYKVGEIYRELGQIKAANPAYAQARQLYEALAADSPNDPDLQHGLAKSLERTGARAKAIPILEKLINPQDPKYHADLGYFYNDAAIYDKDANKAKELEFLHKALAVRERLVRLRPDDPDAHIGYAASLNNIAIKLKEERHAEALAQIQRAAEEMETAYRLRPNHMLTVRFLTIGLNNVAMWGKKAGETEIVLASHRRRVEVLDRRARDNPTVLGFDAELADGYAKLLNALREAGRLEEATKTAEKGGARLAETTEETSDFMAKLVNFRLAVHALTVARAQADPDAEGNPDAEAAMVVKALRQLVLSGWRDTKWSRNDPESEPLRQRADFKELFVRIEELAAADAKAKLTTAASEEKLAARRKILTVLETLAGPPPHARFVRRSLADARQTFAQALLEAGHLDEARGAFAEALAVRERLVQEAPSNEQLRADLAQSQSAAGDLFAAAGRLADAVKTWDKALATLEDGLKANPNSIPFRAALAERLLHVAGQASTFGLWDVAVKHYGRAVAIQSPTEPATWNFIALVAAQTQDLPLLRAAGDLAARGAENAGGVWRHRALTTSPDTAAAHPGTVRKICEETQDYPGHNANWVRALAYLRTGQLEKASQTVANLAPAEKAWPEWQISALLQHRLGHAKAAAEALRQADLLAERRLKEVVAGDQLKVPLIWDEWLHNELLRAEAHQTIHGKPMPASPYERLLRGRIFFALEEYDQADTEFAAAVTLRPEDADIWLTRSRIFAKLGRKDRMAADLLRAQELRGDDPKTWIETGRMLAELGEHKQADTAFVRASALGKGELNRFLEAGWWAVGPYPGEFDVACPPQFGADPSKAVAAVGAKRDLKWQTMPTDLPSGGVGLGPIHNGVKNVSVYGLAYVYADRDRTATVYLQSYGDVRMWVNGQLVFDGFAAWKLATDAPAPIAVTLRTGRNTLLVRTRPTGETDGFLCRFHDHPSERVRALADLGLWAEAAAQQAPLLQDWADDSQVWQRHARFLLAAGDLTEYQAVCARMFERFGRSENPHALWDLGNACAFGPRCPVDVDRLDDLAKRWQAAKLDAPNHRFTAYLISYRAGRFEQVVRELSADDPLKDWMIGRFLLAMAHHRLGRADEARRWLKMAEDEYGNRARTFLDGPGFLVPFGYQGWLDSELFYHEAKQLIDGPAFKGDEFAKAIRTRAQKRLAQLDKAEDHYARLLLLHPDQPRLWIDRGRRLSELKRLDEAAKAFEKAAELAPKDAQVWKERGRAYAGLGKWDEAAADFVKALELAPAKEANWFSASVSVHDQIARSEEVFSRVAKLRPTDRLLWIQRVHYLARTAQWPEAAKASAKVLQLDPADHLSWHFAALLHLQAGDLEEYRRLCKDMLERFADTKDQVIAQRLATALLLAPQEAERVAAVIHLMKNAQKVPNYADWHGLTMTLGHLRLGELDQAAEALRRTTDSQRPAAPALQAMIDYKRGQTDAARQSLIQAVEQFAREAEPGPEENRSDWFIWLAVHQIVKEAESMIPAAPAQLVQAGLSAEEQAARRDRKARADSLATQTALAQIRHDLGQKKEAVAELRAVLAERAKIAAEQPDNADYQIDLATTRLRLGQFLAESGQPAEALTEANEALAFLEKLAAQQPKSVRLRTEAALMVQAVGDVHDKANRPAEALKSWTKAVELLRAALQENPNNNSVAAALGKAEEKLGNYYGSLALWPECGELLARAARRPGGDAWRWLRAGQAALAAGNVAEVRKLAAESFDRFRTVADQHQLTALVELMALTDNPKEKLAKMIPLAEQTARDNPKTGYLTLLLGIYEYRAGDFAAAIQRLEAAEFRNEPWSKAFLAMAHHRLGQEKEAREWQARATDVYFAGLRKRSEQAEMGIGPTWWNAINDLIFYREAQEVMSGKPMPLDPLERLYRARAALHLGDPAKAEAELKAAVETRPDDPQVWLARSRILAKLGRAQEAAADRARALQFAEQALAKRSDDSAAADTLAGLLLEKVEPKWTVLKPLTVKSEGGATLTVQPDDSVLASGAYPDTDIYVLEAEVQGRIGAIRLEAIPDPSMPDGGSGRADSGNFILTDMRVSARQTAVPWSRAYADFSQTHPESDKTLHFPIAHAIDADPSTGWAIFPKHAEPHWAVFIPARPFGGEDKNRLTIRLAFQNKDWARHALGRFRLSVAGVADMVPQTDWFLTAVSPAAKVGSAYLALGKPRQAVEFLTKATANPQPMAADSLVLALAHAQLKEIEQAKKVCAKAAAMLKPNGADSALRPLVREVVTLVGTNTSEAKELIAAATAGEPPAAMTDAVRQNPDKADGYRNRGNWFGERRRWKEAIADYAEAFRLEPESFSAMRLGILLVYAGEIDRYRELSRAILERWGSTETNAVADQTLKTVILLPGYKADAKQLARLAEVASSGDKEGDWYEWYQFATGLYECRTGNYSDALATCRASRQRAPMTKGSTDALTVLNLTVEAMALHGKGDLQEARRSVEEAKAVLDRHVPGLDSDWWHDWLAAQILFQEAEALIAGRKTRAAPASP